VVTQETVRKTYRELAEAFGMTVDAARMKAKRAEKSGRWRIIEGNHPSDTKFVELPASDLNIPQRKGRDEKPNVQAYDPPRTDDEFVRGIVDALAVAQERIKEITNQLSEEKDRHRETAIATARAEAMQSAAALELERLREMVDRLTEDLEDERRSWWRRLIRR
jgi:predicted transcriptional regulator